MPYYFFQLGLNTEVFDLRSFDRSLTLGFPPSLQSRFPLCISAQTTDGYCSEETLLSLFG
jgi:hypothetical protein